MKTSSIIYYYEWDCPSFRSPATNRPQTAVLTTSGYSGNLSRNGSESFHGNTHTALQKRSSWTTVFGLGMVALALGGMSAPLIPRLRLEAQYAVLQTHHIAAIFAPKLSFVGHILQKKLSFVAGQAKPMDQTAPATPALFNPLKQSDGSIIDPVNKEFSLVIPKIGINAKVIPNINPTKEKEYISALKDGIAHSSFSYTPDEDGTVYLFSHSTNYDWFVNDLNAVFYLLKNLEEGDLAVISYKGVAYTYKITGKQVVKPTEIEYLLPEKNGRKLILQTCWPPGSIAERLLIFADLIEDQNLAI